MLSHNESKVVQLAFIVTQVQLHPLSFLTGVKMILWEYTVAYV